MADDFFSLSQGDQREALQYASAQTGRPAHLLEKDVWVVWTLNALFESPLAGVLTFKGGTSLSKGYNVIDRFSEDIDLTYDIRKIIPELIGDSDVLPPSGAQARKWTKEVKARLPGWIKATVLPVVREALSRDGLKAELEQGGVEGEKLLLRYPDHAAGTGYVAPVVTLEFGARATGEPNQVMPVKCDMAGQVPDVVFPEASPRVMSLARTFWEKATAAHVYSAQGQIKQPRFARHWHDLAAIGRSTHFENVLKDAAVPLAVAQHKSLFFSAKDANGAVIDYAAATQGRLRMIPQGAALEALATDYAAMVEDRILIHDALPFNELMDTCKALETKINEVQRARRSGAN